MRKLRVGDAFAGARLIKAAGVKEEITNIIMLVKSGAQVKAEEVGIDLILSVMDGLADTGAEKKMYEFFAGPMEMTAEEINNLEIMEFIEKIKEFIKEQDMDGWKTFFQSVLKLMK